MTSLLGNYPRTLAASALAFVAVAVPCSAWFIAGQRQVERQSDTSRKLVQSKGYKTATRLADDLAMSLERLVQAESRRPFLVYQNLYHDPKGAAEGPWVLPSPLAQGPEDPLIEAYFQVDGDGNLTLPTLNDSFPELGLAGAADQQCELLWKLQDVALFCHLEAARVATGSPFSLPATGASSDPDPVDELLIQKVEMDASAWQQHLQANDVWARLKYGDDGSTPGVVISGRPLAGLDLEPAGERTVTIEVYPFRWHTLPMGDDPALVALRRVTTPVGEWTQGFVVSIGHIAQRLDNSWAATFEPAPPRTEPLSEGDPLQITAGVDGTPWRVRVDLERELAASTEATVAERAEFRRSFVLGALAAGIAALLIVGMVFQSERLARQRIQFAAAAAHELRTPLAGLRIYGEMLAEGLGDPERGREYARRVAAEAERLGRVVTNVLSFTRLERGAVGVHPSPGDLRSAVLEACQRQRPALEESGAELELRIDDAVPTVSFDRDALTHILQNLLDNAEKYTRGVAGRTITVGLTTVGSATSGSKAGSGARDEKVVLRVTDNGGGIPKPLRRKLFEPFTRGEQADAPEGLGLGLVLVKMLVQAQGAAIEYQDAPEGGAMFRVEFPTAASEQETAPAAA